MKVLIIYQNCKKTTISSQNLLLWDEAFSSQNITWQCCYCQAKLNSKCKPFTSTTNVHFNKRAVLKHPRIQIGWLCSFSFRLLSNAILHNKPFGIHQRSIKKHLRSCTLKTTSSAGILIWIVKRNIKT